MVSTSELTRETRIEIAARLGPLLDGLAPLRTLEGAPALGESFPMSLLTEDRISLGDGGLTERLKDMSRWHHQIYVGDAAPAFACSVAAEAGGEPTEIAEVAVSDLPNAVRRAMTWIDANIDNEGEAALILVPSHQVIALRLTGPELDKVVVVAAPPQLEAFAPDRTVTPQDFLAALAAFPAIPGLGSRNDDQRGVE